ncbi:MAG: DUF4271 domain-containing protein [Alistipes shahii]
MQPLPNGATRPPPQFSERSRPSRNPRAFRSHRLRRSRKTPFSRVSCCCSPPPTPCCSTATWATCARCWAASRATRPRQTLLRGPGGSGYSRFLNIATAIGLLFLGVAAVKYGDTLMPGRLAASIPQCAALIFSLLVSLASLGIAAYQTIAVRLAGALTLSQPFIAQLMLLKRTCFALGMILISPPLLLFALCPQGTGGVWFCIIAVELAAAAALYLKETLNLFLSKKVSILHWFLYLCTVEVFPVSLLWLLAVR